ncbi:MAG: hypothetical protein HC895_27410 [Leptolyngbyaceae cyanobacterium SM1_3_5]|nr:hypothetical protein [Leptolyngbyaceae cyanobacterium SM1_3_5]
MSRARGERDRVFVTLGTLQYGFLAGSNSRPHRAALGHTAFTNQVGVVFGANSPKPNRARKEISAVNIVSSFFDPGRRASLVADDWVISGGGRRRGLARTPRSRSVFVDMGTYNYAWNLTTEEHQHMEVLGIEFASGTTPSLVLGFNSQSRHAPLGRLAGASFRRLSDPIEQWSMQPKPLAGQLPTRLASYQRIPNVVAAG